MTLLETVEAEVKQNKGCALLLETSSGLKYTPARELYVRMGYKQICRLENYYGPNDDKILYKKEVK